MATHEQILAHIHLIDKYVNQFGNRWPGKRNDIRSEAILLLIQNLDRALTKPNPMGYLCISISKGLVRFLAEDKMISVPTSTMYDGTPPVKTIYFTYEPTDSYYEPTELREELFSYAETEADKELLGLKEQGYTYNEIAKITGRSDSYIHGRIKEVEEKWKNHN